MGLAYSKIDFEKANQFLQEALEREKQYYGEYSMEVADVYHNIGKIIYRYLIMKMRLFI